MGFFPVQILIFRMLRNNADVRMFADAHISSFGYLGSYFRNENEKLIRSVTQLESPCYVTESELNVRPKLYRFSAETNSISNRTSVYT